MKSLRTMVALGLAGLATLLPAAALGSTIRIVSWNIDADNTAPAGSHNGISYGGSNSGIPAQSAAMETVLEAIGTENAVNSSQAFDVLALQELYQTPSITMGSIVNALNTKYGAGTYAYDTTTDPIDGSGTSGNGPSGLIYNTKTVQITGATSIGTPSGSGEARAPMRYTVQPVGYGTAADLYLYVEHAKSGSYTSGSPTNGARRNTEVQGVRANADALGANAHVVYAGDFNLFNDAAEAAWTTLTAPGAGQAIDTGNWTSQAYNSDYGSGPEFRDDLQLINSATQSQNGLQYVAGSFNVFGNNGSSGYNVAVSSSSNTALGDLSNRSTVLTDLTEVSDHLPVVADYAVVGLPEPGTLVLLALGGLCALRRRRAR
jgi:exonuclease III